MNMRTPCDARGDRLAPIATDRQGGPLEPALGLPGSATTYTGRYTTPRPSGKLPPQAVGGADGRYGGSPEVQTVTRAVPPFGAG